MCIKFVMYADVPSYFVSCCVVYFIFIIFLFSASLVRFFDYSAECFFFFVTISCVPLISQVAAQVWGQRCHVAC